MNEFERVVIFFLIIIDEIVKCLVGLFLILLKRDIDIEKLEVIFYIKMRFKRILEEVFKVNNIERIIKYIDYIVFLYFVDDSEKILLDFIFLIGYNCFDVDEIFEVIIERCSMVV